MNRLSVLPHSRRPPLRGNRARRVDQPDMRKRLREIADKSPQFRIVFFGQQTDVVRQLDGFFSGVAGSFVRWPLHRNRLNIPKATRQKSPFASRQSIDIGGFGCCRRKPFSIRLSLNGLHRADNSWIIAWQEADERHEQQCRVLTIRSVVLNKRIAARIERGSANLGVDRVP